MTQHPFERPGTAITLVAKLECEPRVAEGRPACPVCGTVVDLEALEHSVKYKQRRASTGEPTAHHLSCAMPCPNEGCPVYLKLDVAISTDGQEAWRQKPNNRFDYSYFRDGRPITVEAQAEESRAAPPPSACPICNNALDLAAIIPLPKVLLSGVPLPRSGEPPQHRATAYARCPHCHANLTCSCFVPVEYLHTLRPGSDTPEPPVQ